MRDRGHTRPGSTRRRKGSPDLCLGARTSSAPISRSKRHRGYGRPGPRSCVPKTSGRAGPRCLRNGHGTGKTGHHHGANRWTKHARGACLKTMEREACRPYPRPSARRHQPTGRSGRASNSKVTLGTSAFFIPCAAGAGGCSLRGPLESARRKPALPRRFSPRQRLGHKRPPSSDRLVEPVARRSTFRCRTFSCSDALGKSGSRAASRHQARRSARTCLSCASLFGRLSGTRAAGK